MAICFGPADPTQGSQPCGRVWAVRLCPRLARELSFLARGLPACCVCEANLWGIKTKQLPHTFASLFPRNRSYLQDVKCVSCSVKWAKWDLCQKWKTHKHFPQKVFIFVDGVGKKWLPVSQSWAAGEVVFQIICYSIIERNKWKHFTQNRFQQTV